MVSQHKLSLFCSWAWQIDCEMEDAKDQNKVLVIVSHGDLINEVKALVCWGEVFIKSECGCLNVNPESRAAIIDDDIQKN